ncbi:SusD/RagB family nutrient-binding outer membrane lipoprotein [Fulvivirga sp. M361]|uniref:SusD/RagB family nutrient-binding outer membrane lipoprotein n=1 Tax=Fulvivirga sp. M361 TaxID=2594266 RepID=UPI00117A1CFA|nr:SusD/RagB family nutrient-binding outer membrane lipoprotein [Fulvivirga sp. M361]TRX53009.1 SusD/RagB family nutrient-binding outer membrane lipoprotein [Fulvivirga sp. M361]
MRKIKNYIKIFSLLSLLMVGACESTELDLTQDPNALKPDEASTDFFINAIQEEFGRLIASLEVEASETVRILNMDGRNYRNAFAPTRFDEEWEQAYQMILNDIRTMTPLSEEAGEVYHIGMAQVIEAYTLMTLVDLFGDVPYSEALQGRDNLNPTVDPGANVYAAAETLLTDAITNFKVDEDDVLTVPSQDLFYQGDWENWIKAANSLLLKVYITTRLVDDAADTKFNEIIAAGDYITSNDEDFEFPWATSFNNPDARHPEYVDAYTPGGTNTYMSNWLMDYMQNGKVGNASGTFEAADPRMKYYFYRQSSTVPQDNPNLINCVAETAPPHYTTAGTVFCSLAEGYWGRDHGDDDGIPPDGQLRTAYGVYPVGGKFDDNSFDVIASITLGAGGGGITPIMLASWVDIMRAEMALLDNQNTVARNLLQSGVSKSFEKVRNFGSRDATADMTTAPDDALDAAYVTELGELFDAASDGEKMDLLGSEYFVALFGNGIDAFNFYRRTGRPSTLQPNLEPVPGDFFRSFFYPPVFVERNNSQGQKDGITTQVFWDTGVELLAN